MSGLSDYLIRKREAIKAHEHLNVRPFRYSASATVEGVSGIRRLKIREHQIISDSAPSGAGFGLGPSAAELLGGSLAGCLAHGYVTQAALLDIPLDALTITVSASITDSKSVDHTGTLDQAGLTFLVEIESPAPQADIDRLRSIAEENSLVLNLLRNRTPVESRLDVKAAAA